jgi:tripartite-type tricarboxylate transporter receptor subunit TctC
MRIGKRIFLAGTAGWCVAAALPRAWAQARPAFPSKPLRIVVPNAAGGAADITARTIAQTISGPLGQSVIIENKPSAGGIVAGEMVARAEPDGHTMLLVSSGTAVSAALFKSLPFDTLKDFAPVSQLATFDLAIVVAEGGRFKTLKELLEFARANPGKLNVGTPQIGTTQNLSAELFKSASGLDFQIVPFNGTPPVITAIRGGQLDAGIDILGPLMPQITSKALRALAVMGPHRAPQLADVPAVAESGPPLGNFNVSSWNGLAVPARTPPEAIARLNREIQAALAQQEVQKRFLELNLVAKGGTPQQLEERLVSDMRRWSDVIARAKIPKQ